MPPGKPITACRASEGRVRSPRPHSSRNIVAARKQAGRKTSADSLAVIARAVLAPIMAQNDEPSETGEQQRKKGRLDKQRRREEQPVSGETDLAAEEADMSLSIVFEDVAQARE